MIYLDNAASTFPKPKSVIKTINNSLKINTANPGRSGHFLSEQAAYLIYLQRSKIANFFKCKEENVIFTLNATHAINMALKGVLKPGDHVVISDLEHNSVLRPLVWLRENSGVLFDVVKTDINDDEKTIKSFEDAIKPKTKLVFCTHASNVTGKILPVDRIGVMCKQNNCLFFVDASQTAGFCLPKNYDILCTSGHKGLYGPQGTGLMIIKNRDIFPIATLIQGGTGNNSLDYKQPDILPEALESGTLNTPGILGLGAGVDFVVKRQTEIKAHEMFLFNQALKMLLSLNNIIIYSDLKNNVPLFSFNIKNMHSDKVTDILNQKKICVRGGYHCAALTHRKLGTVEMGAVRVSIGAFNKIDEIEKLVYELKKLTNL